MFVVPEGKKVRMRFVNGGSLAYLGVSVDGFGLEVVGGWDFQVALVRRQ